MDFITGLPLVGGKSLILVVVDRLSKYAHFAYLNSGYTAPQVVTVSLIQLLNFMVSLALLSLTAIRCFSAAFGWSCLQGVALS
ncbi:unnamed protein product [Rhodiola kirilowii]